MRKSLIAAVVAGFATPVIAMQAADAGLVDRVVSATSAPTSETPATQAPADQATEQAVEPTQQAPDALMQVGTSNDQVAKLQARLAGAGHFNHKVTGYYGELTAAAVQAFQSANGLEATGVVDQATLDAVMTLPEPATPAVPAAQHTKKAAGRTTSVEGGSLDSRCLTGKVMCIDKTRQRLYWVVDGQVVDSFSTRTGREGLRTREGEFNVFRMEENSWSYEYKVNMPYAMYFSGGQAVHYSSDFAQNGYGVGSHGCVNLRDRSGIAWLYSQVSIGDKVVVYRS